MEGFDIKYKDLPDYILKITHQIWEEKDVESINQYYAKGMPTRSPQGVIYGAEPVVKATYATLKEFPDRQLLGEDVIWVGNDDEGYFSSHRIFTRATHANLGVYGEPTGKKLSYRVIADCASRNNQVYDEWLVRDQGAIVRQLGLDPQKYADKLIQEEGGIDKCSVPFNQDTPNDVPSDGIYIAPTISKENTGIRYAEILKQIFNNESNAIEKNYDRAIQQEQPGGFTGHGREEISTFWNTFISAFPDSKFTIEHISFTEEKDQAKKAAIRWSLIGSHSGNGNFGNPSNTPVYVMGISHAEFGPRGIKNEWVLFDETIIWKQILMKTG
jgi:predicted ester cyclase